MRIVLDTKVLVSGILTPGRARKVISFVLARSEMHLLTSAPILKEYEQVLSRSKFGLSPTVREMWFELISDKAEVVSTTDHAFELRRDPSDAKFISCAIVGKADFLITGDRDLGALPRFKGCESFPSPCLMD